MVGVLREVVLQLVEDSVLFAPVSYLGIVGNGPDVRGLELISRWVGGHPAMQLKLVLGGRSGRVDAVGPCKEYPKPK